MGAQHWPLPKPHREVRRSHRRSCARRGCAGSGRPTQRCAGPRRALCAPVARPPAAAQPGPAPPPPGRFEPCASLKSQMGRRKEDPRAQPPSRTWINTRRQPGTGGPAAGTSRRPAAGSGSLQSPAPPREGPNQARLPPPRPPRHLLRVRWSAPAGSAHRAAQCARSLARSATLHRCPVRAAVCAGQRKHGRFTHRVHAELLL